MTQVTTKKPILIISGKRVRCERVAITPIPVIPGNIPDHPLNDMFVYKVDIDLPDGTLMEWQGINLDFFRRRSGRAAVILS